MEGPGVLEDISQCSFSTFSFRLSLCASVTDGVSLCALAPLSVVAPASCYLVLGSWVVGVLVLSVGLVKPQS